MNILKSDGASEPFDPDKLRAGLRRSGVPHDLLDRVVNAVSERVREGTTTERISAMVHDQLKRESRAALYRYTLRAALLRLGPAGFKFEKYVASILNAYGYETEFPEEIPGKCVDHEIDVIARKDGRTVMVEAKFRNDFSHFVRLKDTMATWTRFLDVNEGPAGKRFDEVWIISNGKMSPRSQKFASCKGMRLLGWNYPKDAGLATFVDHTALYPITALHDLKMPELERFSRHNMMLCRQAASADPKSLSKDVGITHKRASDIVSVCKQIMAPEGGHDIHKPGMFH